MRRFVGGSSFKAFVYDYLTPDPKLHIHALVPTISVSRSTMEAEDDTTDETASCPVLHTATVICQVFRPRGTIP